MTMYVVRRVAAGALPFLLAACAGISPAPPAVQDASTQSERSFHEAVDLSGRLSVRYQTNGRDEALHGSFTWMQTPGQTVVTLLSPLGQTMAVITVTPEGASLAQSGQPVRSAANVNALTADTLGWPLPVAGMRDWLQGFALDNNGRRFNATPATPEVTTPDGWHLRYAAWMGDNAATRPKRIDLARTTEQAGDVNIRIVIDTWQTH